MMKFNKFSLLIIFMVLASCNEKQDKSEKTEKTEKTEKNWDSIRLALVDSIVKSIPNVKRAQDDLVNSILYRDRISSDNNYAEKIELIAMKHEIDKSIADSIITDYYNSKSTTQKNSLRFLSKEGFSVEEFLNKNDYNSPLRDSILKNESYSESILNISKKYGVQKQKVLNIILEYKGCE